MGQFVISFDRGNVNTDNIRLDVIEFLLRLGASNIKGCVDTSIIFNYYAFSLYPLKILGRKLDECEKLRGMYCFIGWFQYGSGIYERPNPGLAIEFQNDLAAVKRKINDEK